MDNEIKSLHTLLDNINKIKRKKSLFGISIKKICITLAILPFTALTCLLFKIDQDLSFSLGTVAIFLPLVISLFFLALRFQDKYSLATPDYLESVENDLQHLILRTDNEDINKDIVEIAKKFLSCKDNILHSELVLIAQKLRSIKIEQKDFKRKNIKLSITEQIKHFEDNKVDILKEISKGVQ